MNDLVHERLSDLASAHDVGPLDLAALRREATRRSRRARAVLVLAATAAVCAVSVGAALAHTTTTSSLLPASQPPGQVRPTQERLTQVLAAANPSVLPGPVRFCCDGPIRRPDTAHPGPPPYTTLPFGRDDRTAVFPELVMTAGRPDVHVNWAALQPAITDREAIDLARGVVPPDPNPVPVPASERLIAQLDGPVRSVVYAEQGALLASAWSDDGGYTLVSITSQADLGKANWLNAIARDLIQRPTSPSQADHQNLPPHTTRAADHGCTASPRWLPPGATEQATTSLGAASATHFALTGRANTRVAETGPSLAAAVRAHPATEIVFRCGPAGSLTPPVDDPVMYVSKPATVAGSPATLVEQANGLGGVTLSWRTARTEFQLSTDRLNTADGKSGVSDDVLLKMADSVR